MCRSGTEAEPIATICDLAHLEGETVHVWTDRGAMGSYVVTGGTVTLDAPVTRACLGLFDDTHMIETPDILAPVREGSGLGRPKRVKGLGLRWPRTARAQTQRVERAFGQPDVVLAVSLGNRPKDSPDRKPCRLWSRISRSERTQGPDRPFRR